MTRSFSSLSYKEKVLFWAFFVLSLAVVLPVYSHLIYWVAITVNYYTTGGYYYPTGYPWAILTVLVITITTTVLGVLDSLVIPNGNLPIPSSKLARLLYTLRLAVGISGVLVMTFIAMISD